MRHALAHALPEPDPGIAIAARGLSRRFGPVVAVDGIDLDIPRGRIYGFLGPNGSGKSTTLRMLCGLLAPSAGAARVLGHEVPREAAMVRRKLGYMTQKFSLWDDLTVRENLEFMSRIYGVAAARRATRISGRIERYRLVELATRRAGTLSGGQRQRLALAGATLHEPELLLLDEPTSAVDPQSRRDFWESLFTLVERGVTILVSTHYMDEAERCHRLAFIFRGETLALGTPTEIVDARGLRVVELTSPNGIDAADRLRTEPFVDEVAHYGHMLRVATRDVERPVEAVTRALDAAGIGYANVTDSRPNVEDAFVSMVHEDERMRAVKGAA